MGTRIMIAGITGIVFGFGLSLSTMVQPEIVLGFLRWSDFGLLLVLGGAVVVTAAAYQLVPRVMSKPVLGATFGRHPLASRRDTILGAAVFGIGWGCCGVCPGPAIAGLGTGNGSLLFATGGILVGAYLHGWLASRRMSLDA